MFREIIYTIAAAILCIWILAPILYAFHVPLALAIGNSWYGPFVIFVNDNFNFVIFACLVLYIWKGLRRQETQTRTYYGGP